MRRVLLDTDVLSPILKGRNPTVIKRASEYADEHGRFTYAAVSIMFGLHYKDAQRQLRNAEISFNENEVVVPNLDDYKAAGRIRGRARRKGDQLTSDDCLIGAVAQRLGLPVATGNIKRFHAMKEAGLQIELDNWLEP